MRERLMQAFPLLENKELSDKYIETHPNLMWDVPIIPLIRAVPLYILWCVEHHPRDEYLIADDTISALNKYAREKGQGFKLSCNGQQIKVILEFLYFCKKSEYFNIEPILSRAIKNWENVERSLQINKSTQ